MAGRGISPNIQKLLEEALTGDSPLSVQPKTKTLSRD
jgi:hypothetical protein